MVELTSSTIRCVVPNLIDVRDCGVFRWLKSLRSVYFGMSRAFDSDCSFIFHFNCGPLIAITCPYTKTIESPRTTRSYKRVFVYLYVL